MHTRNEDIEEALVTLARSGGKLLRPAFSFFLLNWVMKKTRETTIIKIASLEILHMATLIHDDIIDDSPLRRGAVTIQSQYGKDVAVYTGDLLFTEFFTLIADAMNGSEFMKINAQGMKRLLLGELDQMSHRFDRRMSIPRLFKKCQRQNSRTFFTKLS